MCFVLSKILDNLALEQEQKNVTTGERFTLGRLHVSHN